jgi:hypothetical protein
VRDRAVEEAKSCSEEEAVEEILGQLWVVPKPDKPRVRRAMPDGGCLVWIRRDWLRERQVRPEDCFPMSRSHKFLQHSKRVPLSELCCEGSRPTYAKVLKRVPMAEGGRWVWQPDRTQAQMVPQKGHVQN